MIIKEIGWILESLESLLGKNAGAIAMTLNLPYAAPYNFVIDAAITAQEGLRSPWTFAGLDQSGNTLWMSQEQDRVLRVDPAGVLDVERIQLFRKKIGFPVNSKTAGKTPAVF